MWISILIAFISSGIAWWTYMADRVDERAAAKTPDERKAPLKPRTWLILIACFILAILSSVDAYNKKKREGLEDQRANDSQNAAQDIQCNVKDNLDRADQISQMVSGMLSRVDHLQEGIADQSDEFSSSAHVTMDSLRMIQSELRRSTYGIQTLRKDVSLMTFPLTQLQLMFITEVPADSFASVSFIEALPPKRSRMKLFAYDSIIQQAVIATHMHHILISSIRIVNSITGDVIYRDEVQLTSMDVKYEAIKNRTYAFVKLMLSEMNGLNAQGIHSAQDLENSDITVRLYQFCTYDEDTTLNLRTAWGRLVNDRSGGMYNRFPLPFDNLVLSIASTHTYEMHFGPNALQPVGPQIPGQTSVTFHVPDFIRKPSFQSRTELGVPSTLLPFIPPVKPKSKGYTLFVGRHAGDSIPNSTK